MSDTIPEHNPARGRTDRVEATAGERRKRRGGTLDQMNAKKLDIFSKDQLDTENFVYRWVNDEDHRPSMLYEYDYDFVGESDIKNYNNINSDNESDGRVRKLCGTTKDGKPLFTYLMAKPKDWWEDDNNKTVHQREAMMDGVVYKGDVELANEDIRGDNIYASKSNKLGGAARRQGHVTK